MKKLTSVLIVCILLLSVCVPSVCAQASCISELAVAVGNSGTSQLESKGYTVLFQGMNIVSDENSAVFLGYKKGGEGITDLRVSATKSATVQVNGISYALVSETSLNYGTDGKPIYLYATKDKKAGNGIAALETVTVTESDDTIEGMFNDGSFQLLDVDGKLANLDNGISGSNLYLKLIPQNVVNPYIKKACLVTGSTENEALQKAAESGYNYFLDEDLSKTADYTFIAYSRTSDKSKALTGIMLASSDKSPVGYTATAGTVNGKSVCKLYCTTGGKTPLLDLSSKAMFKDEFTLGEWAKFFFASAPQTAAQEIMMQESAYSALQKSKDVCSAVGAGGSETGISLFAMYCGKVSNTQTVVIEAETETTTEVVAQTEAAMTDKYVEVDKIEETTEATDGTNMTVSSAVGKGNIKVVIVLAVVLVLAVAVAYFIKKTRKQIGEKDS